MLKRQMKDLDKLETQQLQEYRNKTKQMRSDQVREGGEIEGKRERGSGGRERGKVEEGGRGNKGFFRFSEQRDQEVQGSDEEGRER